MSEMSKTLTKADLTRYLFSKLGLSSMQDAKKFVRQVFEAICFALEQGEDVKLSGFGKFCLREKGERPGRNPKTRKSAPISARRVVTFRPSQRLKQTVKHVRKVKEKD